MSFTRMTSSTVCLQMANFLNKPARLPMRTQVVSYFFSSNKHKPMELAMIPQAKRGTLMLLENLGPTCVATSLMQESHDTGVSGDVQRITCDLTWWCSMTSSQKHSRGPLCVVPLHRELTFIEWYHRLRNPDSHIDTHVKLWKTSRWGNWTDIWGYCGFW